MKKVLHIILFLVSIVLVFGVVILIVDHFSSGEEKISGTTTQVVNGDNKFYSLRYNICPNFSFNEGNLALNLNKDNVNKIFNTNSSFDIAIKNLVSESYKSFYEIADDKDNDFISDTEIISPLQIMINIESDQGYKFDLGCNAYLNNDVLEGVEVFIYSLNSEGKILRTNVFEYQKGKTPEYIQTSFKAQANTLRNVGYSIYSSNSSEKELDNGVKQVYYLDLVKVNEKNTTCSHVASELWDLFEYEVTQEAPKEEKTLSFDVDKMLGLIDGSYKDEFGVDAFDKLFKNYQETTGNDVEWYTRHFAYKYYKNPATLERIAICLEVSIDSLRTDDLRINNGWSNDSQIDGLKVYLYDSEGEHLIFDASAYSKKENYSFNDLSFDITGFIEDVSEFKVYDETLGDYQATNDTDMSDYLTSEIIVLSTKNE